MTDRKIKGLNLTADAQLHGPGRCEWQTFIIVPAARNGGLIRMYVPSFMALSRSIPTPLIMQQLSLIAPIPTLCVMPLFIIQTRSKGSRDVIALLYCHSRSIEKSHAPCPIIAK